MELHLDHKAIGELLMSSEMRKITGPAAAAVAAAVDGHGKPVRVRSYTTDRVAEAVSIAHPAGLAIEAKYGALSRAAASVGLQVRSNHG